MNTFTRYVAGVAPKIDSRLAFAQVRALSGPAASAVASSLPRLKAFRYPRRSVACVVARETSPSLVYGAALLMRLGSYSPSRVRIPESPRVEPVCMLAKHERP